MIGILLNNYRDILLRPAVVNLIALLLLLFKICVNFVSSLHIATVEKVRYAFLLFSIILTVSTVVYFASRMSCLRHATSCRHRKLFYIKLFSCVKFEALFSKRNSVTVFENGGFMTYINMRREKQYRFQNIQNKYQDILKDKLN